MTREERIEEAAKAILDAAETPEYVRDEQVWGWARRDAEAALAVFEKAQTPTDDEREALRQVREFATKERDSIRGQYGAGSSTYAGYANACDDILGILDDVSPYPDTRRTVQGEPTERVIVMCARCGLLPVVASDQINSDVVVCDRCAFAEGRESAQGEPSDALAEPSEAAVDAALKAAEGAGPLTPIRERLRVALRAAAAEATTDGEIRRGDA